MRKDKVYNREGIHNFKELLNRASTKFGEKAAFTIKKEDTGKEPKYIDISYRQFKEDIVTLGTSLLDMDLEEKRVAVISPNRYEWCVSYLAVTTSNMVVVPLDRSLPDNEIENSIIRSKVEAVIFDSKYVDVFYKLKRENTSSLKKYICMDNIESNEISSYSRIMENGKKSLEKGLSQYEQVKIDNEKMTIMLFTSGTTSMSKIVMLSQSNICANLNAVRNIIDLKETDTFLSFLPLHHTFECSTTFLTGINSGIRIVFCDGIKYISQNIKEYHVTGFACVPLLLETMYKKMQKGIEESGKAKLVNVLGKISDILLKLHIDVRRKLFKSILDKIGGELRIAVSGAAAINPEVVKGFNRFGIIMIQGYGLTETSPVLAAENDKYRRPGSTGFPLYNIELKIDHPDENGIGEIIAKGPSIMLGYYENEEATNEVLKDGWFYTGDLGCFDKDGYLYIKGRKKTVIVLKNGKNIYPEEIENLINELPFVSESMIYSRKRRADDLELACKIVINKDTVKEIWKETSEEKYRDVIWEEIKKINRQMPPYKCIRDIIITEEPLIKTTTQKIKRYEEMKKIEGVE